MNWSLKRHSRWGLCGLEASREATAIFMKDFRSLDQNTLAIAINKIIFPLFFFLLLAYTGVLQTATMKTAGNVRQREEMDLAQNVQWGDCFGMSWWSTPAQQWIWEAACTEQNAKPIIGKDACSYQGSSKKYCCEKSGHKQPTKGNPKSTLVKKRKVGN